MAISSTSVLLALTLLFCGFSSSSQAQRDMKVSPDLISTVCSKTTLNPSYCIKTLRSDPRSRAAKDLTVLGRMVIDIAKHHTISTAKLVKAHQQEAKAPALEKKYRSCMVNYKETFDNLDDSRIALDSQDYFSLANSAALALGGPDTCDENFAPRTESPQLLQASLNVQELCSAVLIIANLLIGGA